MYDWLEAVISAAIAEVSRRRGPYAIGLTLSGIILFFFTYVDPYYYHAGWNSFNRAWFFPIAVLFVISIIASFTSIGFVINIVCGLISATIFALLYESPQYSTDFWLLLTWLLHWFAVAFFLAILVGGTYWVVRQVALHQTSKRKRPKKRRRKTRR